MNLIYSYGFRFFYLVFPSFTFSVVILSHSYYLRWPFISVPESVFWLNFVAMSPKFFPKSSIFPASDSHFFFCLLNSIFCLWNAKHIMYLGNRLFQHLKLCIICFLLKFMFRTYFSLFLGSFVFHLFPASSRKDAPTTSYFICRFIISNHVGCLWTLYFFVHRSL